MNLILNYCWGNKLFDNDDFLIYLESLDSVKNVDKILLVKDCDISQISKIAHHYDKVIEFKKDILYLDQVFYEFLCSCSDAYEYVLMCDSRDIIFQKDPFDYIIKQNKNLYLVCEGMQVQDSDPNYDWMFRLNKTQWQHDDKIYTNQVINGGVLAGKIEHLIYLLLISFTNTNRNSRYEFYNQTIYSYIEFYLRLANFVEICHPLNSLYCITGEGVGKHNIPMKIVNGIACNENDEPYFILHQWDRTFFAEEIRNRYLEGKNK